MLRERRVAAAQPVRVTMSGRYVAAGPLGGVVEGRGVVEGVRLTLDDPSSALLLCDDMQGFRGWSQESPSTRRVLVRIGAEDGDRWCWCYRPVASD